MGSDSDMNSPNNADWKAVSTFLEQRHDHAHHGFPLLHFCFASRQAKHAACCRLTLCGPGLSTVLAGSLSATPSSGILTNMRHRFCNLVGGGRCCRIKRKAKRCERRKLWCSLRRRLDLSSGSEYSRLAHALQVLSIDKPSLLRSSGPGYSLR